MSLPGTLGTVDKLRALFLYDYSGPLENFPSTWPCLDPPVTLTAGPCFVHVGVQRECGLTDQRMTGPAGGCGVTAWGPGGLLFLGSWATLMNLFLGTQGWPVLGISGRLGAGDRKGGRGKSCRQGPEAASQAQALSGKPPPELSSMKAKEASSPAHFP